MLRVSGAASYEELKRVPKTEDINFMFGHNGEEKEEKTDSLDGFIVADEEVSDMDVDNDEEYIPHIQENRNRNIRASEQEEYKGEEPQQEAG